MSDHDDEDRRAIRELYELSRERLLDRVAAVEAAVAELAEDRLGDATRRRGLEEAHKLAGSLGTFGVPVGSTLAKDLERLLSAGPVADDAPRAVQLAEALRAAVVAGPA